MPMYARGDVCTLWGALCAHRGTCVHACMFRGRAGYECCWAVENLAATGPSQPHSAALREVSAASQLVSGHQRGLSCSSQILSFTVGAPACPGLRLSAAPGKAGLERPPTPLHPQALRILPEQGLPASGLHMELGPVSLTLLIGRESVGQAGESCAPVHPREPAWR